MGWTYPIAIGLLSLGIATAGAAPHSQPHATTRATGCFGPLTPWPHPQAICTFELGGTRFRISDEGALERLAGGRAEKRVSLPLPKEMVLVGLDVADLGADVLLVGEVADFEYGGGLLVCVDARTLRVKWHLDVPGFNLSTGSIEDNRLYQAGIGFLAAVDLRKGTFVWIHRGLYDEVTDSFNAFETPEIRPTEVLFRERRVDGKPPRLIRVSKTDGAIHIE